MKKLIIIIAVLLIMGCEKITILEIKAIDECYRVSYVKKANFGKWTTHDDFYTLLGVENFLTEVADEDLSQWRVK